MTLFSLSVRNLKKSMKNYMIYFLTLILGVAIFYVFSSVGSQTVLINVLKNEMYIIETIEQSLAVVSVFVAVVLGFLIVYASSFLMKRRKKEFGIYMLLGMSKRKISFIIIIETLLIGLISLVIGLFVGIAASQGMSIAIANMFEADMTSFEFVISSNAIIKTLIYFCIMYGIVILLDVFIVGKAKLINLLTAAKKAEKNTTKNPYICFVVFIISMFLLCTAYYKVTAGFETITTGKEFVGEIVKGIIGNFGFFWSVSGFFTLIIKSSKRLYYRKLNSFTTNELSSRINTTVFSAGIISLMLFFTICILSCSIAIKKSIDDGLKKYTPFDLEFSIYRSQKTNDSSIEIMKKNGWDLSNVDIKCQMSCYYLVDVNYDDFEISEEEMGIVGIIPYNYVNVSEYNRLAELTKSPKISLRDNQYAIVGNYFYSTKEYNKSLKAGKTINIYGKEFEPAYDKCVDGFYEMASTNSEIGFVVLPDSFDYSVIDDYRCDLIYADYNTKDESIIKKCEETYLIEIANDSDNPHEFMYGFTISKKDIYVESVSLTLMVVFVGLYIGMVFMISGAAILALKLLSEATDNKEKYSILRKIGTDNKMINKSLFAQCGIYFGLPLLVAIIHSVFGIQTGLYFLESFGRIGLTSSIILTGIFIVIIYGGYGILTYLGCVRIINEK